RDHLIGVEVAQRRTTEQLLDVRAHHRRARRSADQNDAVELGPIELGVLEGAPAWTIAALAQERAHDFGQLRAVDRAADRAGRAGASLRARRAGPHRAWPGAARRRSTQGR